MTDIIFGVEVAFHGYEEVIIDSAEVKGTVIGVRLDSNIGMIDYLVEFPHGSIWVDSSSGLDEMHTSRGDYDCSDAWFTESELRKIV